MPLGKNWPQSAPKTDPSHRSAADGKLYWAWVSQSMSLLHGWEIERFHFPNAVFLVSPSIYPLRMFLLLNCQETILLPFTVQVLAISSDNLNAWRWDMKTSVDLYPRYMAILVKVVVDQVDIGFRRCYDGTSPCLMGKSTMFMAIFYIAMFVYQRFPMVFHKFSHGFPHGFYIC